VATSGEVCDAGANAHDTHDIAPGESQVAELISRFHLRMHTSALTGWWEEGPLFVVLSQILAPPFLMEYREIGRDACGGSGSARPNRGGGGRVRHRRHDGQRVGGVAEGQRAEERRRRHGLKRHALGGPRHFDAGLALLVSVQHLGNKEMKHTSKQFVLKRRSRVLILAAERLGVNLEGVQVSWPREEQGSGEGGAASGGGGGGGGR